MHEQELTWLCEHRNTQGKNVSKLELQSYFLVPID